MSCSPLRTYKFLLLPTCVFSNESATSMMPPGGVWRIERRLIHPSAWKENSANFALPNFSEAPASSSFRYNSSDRSERACRKGARGVMSAEENKAVARRELEEIWTKGNLAAAEEIYAPNYTRPPTRWWRGHTWCGSYQAVRRWHARSFPGLGDRPLNAWCELFGQNLSGRCPQIRVGLLTNPEGKGPTPYARCGHPPHHTLRYGRRLQPLPAAKKAARSPSLPLRERGAYPGHLCPLEPFHQREGFLPLR